MTACRCVDAQGGPREATAAHVPRGAGQLTPKNRVSRHGVDRWDGEIGPAAVPKSLSWARTCCRTDQSAPWKAKPRPGSAVTSRTRTCLRRRAAAPTIRRGGPSGWSARGVSGGCIAEVVVHCDLSRPRLAPVGSPLRPFAPPRPVRSDGRIGDTCVRSGDAAERT